MDIVQDDDGMGREFKCDVIRMLVEERAKDSSQIVSEVSAAPVHLGHLAHGHVDSRQSHCLREGPGERGLACPGSPGQAKAKQCPSSRVDTSQVLDSDQGDSVPDRPGRHYPSSQFIPEKCEEGSRIIGRCGNQREI
jgi:hypothetical protein